MRIYVSVAMVGLVMMLAFPVLGHHSAGNFWYTDRNVEIAGVVKSLKMVNPHPELVVEVTEGNGTKSLWRVSGGGNASAMIRAGWKSTTLPLGLMVKVEGHPSRTEGAHALLAGNVTKPDGQVLNFSAGSGPVDQ